jgi:hypothetical protein
MDTELTREDVDLLLESLDYSRMNVTHGTAPLEVKRPKVQRIDAVLAKLRAVRNGALMRSMPSS